MNIFYKNIVFLLISYTITLSVVVLNLNAMKQSTSSLYTSIEEEKDIAPFVNSIVAYKGDSDYFDDAGPGGSLNNVCYGYIRRSKGLFGEAYQLIKFVAANELARDVYLTSFVIKGSNFYLRNATLAEKGSMYTLLSLKKAQFAGIDAIQKAKCMLDGIYIPNIRGQNDDKGMADSNR